MNREENINAASHYKKNEEGEGHSKVTGFDKKEVIWSTKSQFFFYIVIVWVPPKANLNSRA